MRRILIITHSYWPLLNPRAFRWTALAEYWAARGLRVDVLCAWVPPLPRTELLNGVTVLRVGGTLTERLRKLFSPGRTHPNIQAADSSAPGGIARKSMITRGIHWLHDATWKRIYWPDYACLWRRPSERVATHLIDQHEYDLVISVSDPFTSHLVALRVKAHRPFMRWIADMGDPFSFRDDGPPNNYALYESRNRGAEQNLFAHADVVSVTCDGTAKAYKQLSPGHANKITVIPPLVPPGSSPRAGQRLFDDDGAYRLLFVGTLYKRFRNPTYLLHLFTRLREDPARRMQLHFVGSINDCAECFQPFQTLLGDDLVLHGLRNREYVSRAIDSANLLVNIANSNPYQLPSKLAEYAQAEKPILNLTRLSDDAATEFLTAYPRLLNLKESAPIPSPQQIQSLKEFIESAPGTVDRIALTRWLRPFTIERIASAYMECEPAAVGEGTCSRS